MHSSAFYEKCFRCVCVSVVLTTVGWGIYAVLSDSGFIPKVEEVLPDSRIGKALSCIQNTFTGGKV